MRSYTETLRFSTVLLAILGLCFVASATSYKSIDSSINIYIIKQSIFIFLGITIMYSVREGVVSFFYNKSGKILIVSMIALLSTIIPGVGIEVNGSYRWINIGMNIQPSELIKIAWILYLSSVLSKAKDSPKKMVGRVGVPYVIICSILAYQPDLGSMIIITLMTVVGTFLIFDSFSFKKLAFVMSVIISAISVMILTSEYRMRRVAAFLSPEDDPLDKGYQLMQSFKAMATGNEFGVGWGNSFSVMGYLPEAHTDYIFSTIVEQFGIFFAIALVIAIMYIPISLMSRAIKMKQEKNKVTVSLISILMVFEVIVNISSSIGLMPPKGLGLPFMSYGGSSIMVHFILVGLALSIVEKEPISN